MKSYITPFIKMQNEAFLKKHTEALTEKELPQTNAANHAAADYIYDLLRESGFQAERLNFTSDGIKDCQDKIMPLCFDVTYARLTVESKWEGERLIADYEKEPFSIIRFSTPTPNGGITVPLVPFENMLDGADVKGALVLLPPDLFPTDKALIPILDRGAIGLVSGTARTASLSPNTVHWANNCTETNSWYVNAGERDFIGFCVTPSIREKLYEACKEGPVLLKAETDCHRFVGEMPAVTALIPGESSREFWVLAHSGEPLVDDNSAGIIGAIYAMISIRQAIENGDIPPLKYSVRLLFAPELYGYAAFAEHFGGVLRDRCIGAISIDGIPLAEDKRTLKLIFAPPALPFYGNVLLEAIWRSFEKMHPLAPKIDGWGHSWGNDCFMSDTSVGLPTIMPEPSVSSFWHNSKQRCGYIEYDRFAASVAGYTAHIAAIVCFDGEKFAASMPLFASLAIKRLEKVSMTKPPRAGSDARSRLSYLAEIAIADIRSFACAGVNQDAIDCAIEKIESFVASTNVIPADALDGECPLNKYKNIITSRLTVGIPHDFARVPLSERYRPFILPLMGSVFSGMDGKKDLAELITRCEWEEDVAYSSEQLTDFYNTLLLMDKYGYISIEK